MTVIALTFDNGPSPVATPQVLEILERRAVKACFFVVGARAATADGTALLRDIKDAGHRIGNHTWSHKVPLGEIEDAAASVDEIVQTEELLGDTANPAKLFRPFGREGAKGRHLLSPAAFRHLVAERYTCVLWNCVPRDWDDEDGWVDRARAQMAEQPTPYMVLHDIEGACTKRLDGFIAATLDAGHSFTQDIPDSEIIIDRGVAKPNAGDSVAPEPAGEPV